MTRAARSNTAPVRSTPGPGARDVSGHCSRCSADSGDSRPCRGSSRVPKRSRNAAGGLRPGAGVHPLEGALDDLAAGAEFAAYAVIEGARPDGAPVTSAAPRAARSLSWRLHALGGQLPGGGGDRVGLARTGEHRLCAAQNPRRLNADLIRCAREGGQGGLEARSNAAMAAGDWRSPAPRRNVPRDCSDLRGPCCTALLPRAGPARRRAAGPAPTGSDSVTFEVRFMASGREAFGCRARSSPSPARSPAGPASERVGARRPFLADPRRRCGQAHAAS